MATKKYTQGKDGYWRTKAWDGTYDVHGQKNRIHLKSAKSSADLEKQVNALKRKIEAGQQIQQSSLTFLEYADEWLSVYKAVRSNNTKAMYQNIINKHFSILANVKLQDLRKIHIQMVINSAANKPRTCQQIMLTFKQIVRSAVDDQLLPEPALRTLCAGVDRPAYTPGEKRALSEVERNAIQQADFTPMERTFVYIIYGCGLRRGEVLALKPLDINLKSAELTVRQSVEFIGNNPGLKAPKSINGARSVPMPPFLVNHLKTYLPTLNGHYLMHTRDGGMMTKSSYRRMWDSIQAKINIAAGGTDSLRIVHGLTAHTFRHNYCSNLCYQIPLISTKKIAQLLGDTEKMVVDVYSHIMDEKENVQEVVNSAISL